MFLLILIEGVYGYHRIYWYLFTSSYYVLLLFWQGNIYTKHNTRVIEIKLQDIDQTIMTHKEDFRYHSIAMKHEQRDSQEWTCCQIKLFGGVFDGTVYLTNRILTFKEGCNVRIDF